MRLSIVFHTAGLLVRLFAAAPLPAIAVAAAFGEWFEAAGLAVTSLVALVLGVMMRRAGGYSSSEEPRIRRTEGLAVVAFTWLAIAHVAAIPYVWTGLGFI